MKRSPESQRGTVWPATAALLAAVCTLAALPAAAQGPCGSGAPLAPEDFTLMTLPDTQYYTTGSIPAFPTFAIQTSWITITKDSLQTAFVTHLGDIVNNENDVEGQYQIASGAMTALDGVLPYGFAPGNHDIGSNGVARLYDEYFPASRFLGRPGFAGLYNGTRSNYELFSAGGLDFLVLHLEYDPPDHVLDWANAVLAQHPARRVILSIHLFLIPNVSSVAQLPTSIWDRPDGNSPREIWDELVHPNCNVFLVVNGHYINNGDAENHITGSNACGDPVHLALSNYQDRSGGSGWLRYYTFVPAQNEIRAFTYSPLLSQCESDANSEFVLPYEMGGAP